MDQYDGFFYRLPVLGVWFQRTYRYFKNHTATTNLIHVAFGIGLAFMVVGGDYFVLGIIAVSLASLAHLYAFVRAK